jgi:hypothetical protein
LNARGLQGIGRNLGLGRNAFDDQYSERPQIGAMHTNRITENRTPFAYEMREARRAITGCFGGHSRTLPGPFLATPTDLLCV